ncbi:MAG: NADH-quinone oxidoreductase subunit D [Candidatus Omnitrophica bacterium]|nr:NADH-quinone oxidoreductase subunit D [Candidatus Omnitrophota bacterium]
MATQTRNMLLNVGPSHPAMHGVIRLIMELEGEKIKGVDVEIGYLHRAFEKMCETVMYAQCFPYTDRLNYVSPLINNVGFAMTVEKLLGIDIPERAKYIRVIMSEISRVTDHLTCIGASAMELGAMSVFLYMIKAREYLYELVEEITGARLTISYVRIGGVKADLTPGFVDKAFQKIADVRKVLIEVDELLTRNRIFFDRMKGIGKISAEDAIAYGITGPFLRSTGVAYDVRKASPYLIYDRLDFEVPTGTTGDNLDRYFVRMAEMEQSLRMIEQCFQQIPDGPISGELTGCVIPAAEMVDRAKMGQTEDLIEDEVDLDPTLQGGTKRYYDAISADKKDVVLPAKEDTYGNIEGLMNHFKLVMYGHGIRPPVGEVYFPVEGANGELGFYIVSDGRDLPWRVRVHPPCFPIMAALPKCLVGGMMADMVSTFGSVNMIAGELDR